MADRTQRRLTTIVAADIAGFSRLIGVDEEGTLAAQRKHRTELIEPLISEHHGRIANTAGDSFLLEFPSAVEAVRCSVAVQDGIAERNRSIVADRRIEYRIGVNVGDVMADGEDLLGDGVNVAARLENICAPGGIILSDDAYRQVRDRLDIALEDGGEHLVKNIARPVQIWRWGKAAEAIVTPMTDAALALPDKPSIAVLPFDNMSGDPEQEYFADGMAEDIITALSRYRWFSVIARNSSFSFKGRNVDVRSIGKQLGVRYLLEGSVRKGGNRLRITAQLVEAATGNHLWANKFDGAIEDVFELQDQITEGVAGAIEPTLRRAEIERARSKRQDNLDAYDFYLRALPHAWVYSTDEAERAIVLLENALAIDPDYVAAHGLAAWCNSIFATITPGDPRRAVAIHHARSVLGPDTDDSLALAFAAFALALFDREYDIAVDAIERALAITPSSAIVLSFGSLVYAYSGYFQKAINSAEASLRLSPNDPMRFNAELAAAYGYYFTQRYQDSAEAVQRCIHVNPLAVPAIAFSVACFFKTGDARNARKMADRLLEVVPDFSVKSFIMVGRFPAEQNKEYAAALLDAGLPE
jgi:TolB-like protein/class 3 adenylate cyclase